MKTDKAMAERFETEAHYYADQLADLVPPERLVIVAFAEGTAFGISCLRKDGKDIASVVKALRNLASRLEQN